MTQTLTKSLAAVGEEISHELGAKMAKDYQVANPSDVHAYIIGRNIIEQILSQPGCVGIQFYNAYNEIGQKTLVYVGLNADAKPIIKYTAINNEGILENQKGIVADRVIGPHIDTDFGTWGMPD